jgi:hypothetical protein
MYLASLASNAKEIESYIRPLRELKRLRSKDDMVTPEEEEVLDRIEESIKHYLLTSEHLRSFTSETLEQHLYERTDAHRLVRNLRWRVAAILFVATLLAVGAYLLPSSTSEVRLRLGINTGITSGYIIGAYLFLTSHRKFSLAHQGAYRLFSYAFIVGSIITSVNLALTIAYKGVVPWSEFWYVTMMTYLTFAVMYFGARQLASLYGVKNLAMKVWWVVPLALGGASALMFFPWAWTPGVRSGVNSIGGFFAFIFTLHTGWLMYRVWRLANPLYKAPTKALGIGFMCISVAWATIVVLPTLPVQIGSVLSIGSSLLFIICALFLIRSGYALSKLSQS